MALTINGDRDQPVLAARSGETQSCSCRTHQESAVVRSREPRVYVHPLTSLTRNSDNARSLLQLSVVSEA
jgi:hypothetical protein